MTWWRDVAGILRDLARRPTFSVPTLVVLILGIGAVASIFAVVEGVLLSPLPWPDDGELVVLCEEHPSVDGYCIGSVPTIHDLQEHARSLDAAGTYRTWTWTLEGPDGSTNPAGGIASPEVFPLMGAEPALGRFFTRDEIGPERDDVAVLSHAFWQQRFGGDPGILGSTLSLDGEPIIVVGVLGAGFELPTAEWVELWRPLHVDPGDEESRGWRGFATVGRLAPDVTVHQAAAELEALYRDLGDRTEAVTADWDLDVRSLRDQLVGDVRRPLLSFMAAAGLLLGVVCANVATLLLARGVRRERDFAVRAALGARRAHLVRHVLMESAVLTGLAGVGAIFLARLGTQAFAALAPPGIPRLEAVKVDGPVFLFALGVSVLVILVAGLLPALRLRDERLADSLRTRHAGGSAPGAARTRRMLVVAELALSLVLLFGTALVARTFWSYTAWEPGFDREGLITFSAFASPGSYPTREEVTALWARLEDELRSLPGVVAVGTASSVPLRGGVERSKVRARGMEGVREEELPSARWYDVGPTYFSTLGVPVVEGRDLQATDRAGSPPVALVNETFARRTWPGEAVAGQWIAPAALGTAVEQRLEVVGVVADVPPLVPGQEPEPEVYWSNAQFGRWGTIFLVRMEAEVGNLAPALQERIRAVDPDLSPGRIESMEALVDRRLVGPRFNLWLMGVFGVVATFLGLVGLYGVLAYDVAQRARAIGIRMALGSSRSRVIRKVVQEAGGLALVGVIVGAAMAWLLAGLVSSLVRGVSATDLPTLGGTSVLLVLLALASSWGPALRASRLDPVRLLRE